MHMQLPAYDHNQTHPKMYSDPNTHTETHMNTHINTHTHTSS